VRDNGKQIGNPDAGAGLPPLDEQKAIVAQLTRERARSAEIEETLEIPSSSSRIVVSRSSHPPISPRPLRKRTSKQACSFAMSRLSCACTIILKAYVTPAN